MPLTSTCQTNLKRSAHCWPRATRVTRVKIPILQSRINTRQSTDFHSRWRQCSLSWEPLYLNISSVPTRLPEADGFDQVTNPCMVGAALNSGSPHRHTLQLVESREGKMRGEQLG